MEEERSGRMKYKKKINYKIIFSYILLFVVLDQVTKILARTYNIDFKIAKFLSLTYITNTGMAFGLFQGNNNIFLFLYLIILGIVLFNYDKIIVKYKVPFILVTAGIAGNLIDRIFLKHVVDFINFSFWPAFNIADSAICIGIIVLVIQLIKEK